MSAASRKAPRNLDPGQMGFIHYEILSRIWVEGTLRIKELNEQMVKEIVEAFVSTYPHDSEKCFPQKIRRVFNELRPVRIQQNGEVSASAVLFEYSEPVKRHAALFALQQQATRILEETNQLLAEASMDPASREFAEHLAILSNLHHEFEDWCVKYGRDIVAACNTRNALRRALVQMNDAILSRTQKEQLEKEPVSSNLLGGAKGVADSIYSKQFSFLRKASKLVDLHTEYAVVRQRESNQRKHQDGSSPGVSSNELAPSIRTAIMAPIINVADSFRELESEISSTEKILLSLYEKKRKFGMSVMAPVHKRRSKFLAFFLIPDGKVKHFSIGLDCDSGDESACQLLLAKHGYAPVRKGKRIKHYTTK